MHDKVLSNFPPGYCSHIASEIILNSIAEDNIPGNGCKFEVWCLYSGTRPSDYPQISFKEPEVLGQAHICHLVFIVLPASASLHAIKRRSTVTYTDNSTVSFPVEPGCVLVNEMHRIKGIETAV